MARRGRIVAIFFVVLIFSVILAAFQNCTQRFNLPANFASSNQCSYGNDWTTIDQTPAGTGAMSGVPGPRAFAFDSVGVTYAFGLTAAGGVSHAVVRKSSDENSWSTIDDESGASNGFFGGGIDTAGNLYAVGQTIDATTHSHWIVRESIDTGLTWTTVDDYQYDNALQDANGNYANAFAADAFGNIYVSGVASDINSIRHAVTRMSFDAGASWTTVDDYQLVAGQTAYAWSVKTDMDGNVYVMGNAYDASGLLVHGFVRESADSGTTWQTIVDYTGPVNAGATFVGFSVDSLADLFVIGSYTDASMLQHGLTRESFNNGISFADSDDFAYAAATNTFFNGSAVGIGNTAFAVGSGNVSGTTDDHWIVRKGPASWTTTDDFQLAAGQSAYAVSAAVDTSGAVLVGGSANDAAGNPVWITRKLSCK